MDSASALRLRAELLDQMAYLLMEVAAMEPLLPRMVEEELSHADQGLSVKQGYGAIVEWDRQRVIPLLRSLNEQNGQGREASGTDWNALSLGDVLQRVAATRREVLTIADSLGKGPWRRQDEVCKTLHETVQHDTTRLQTIAKQLNRGV